MKNLRSLLAVFVLFIIISGCGGENGSGNSNNNIVFSSTAQEVAEAYDNRVDDFLENCFTWDENGNLVQLNPEQFPETRATIEVFQDLSDQVIIEYQGEEIYNETKGWGIYTFHGHTDDGTYVIFIQEYDYGSYSGKSRIFINGEEIFSLPCYGVDRIRDYGNGWLIFVSFTGSARNPDGHVYAQAA